MALAPYNTLPTLLSQSNFLLFLLLFFSASYGLQGRNNYKASPIILLRKCDKLLHSSMPKMIEYG